LREAIPNQEQTEVVIFVGENKKNGKKLISNQKGNTEI